jgi:hypothetical protein
VKVLLLGLRIAAATIVVLLARVVGAVIVGFADGGGSAAPAAASGSVEGPAVDRAAEQALLFLTVLGVSFLETLVLVHPIRRSKSSYLRLTLVVFLLVFGATTLQPQLETAFFGVLGAGMILRIVAMGAITAAIVAPITVFLLRDRTRRAELDLDPRSPGMSANEWAWRLGAVGLGYVILYALFGYFVAWQSPEVRAYYGASEGDAGIAGIGLFAIPSLGPFQFLRGLLWAGIALPVIRLMRRRWQETGLALGLLFAVLMNAQLLLPNPYMPESVRLVHLAETASSNFLLGLWIAWILRRARPA